MSVKTMGRVWDLQLPTSKKFLLLAMADHADHDHGNIWPSIDTLSRKTGYTDRHIRRLIKELKNDDKLLVKTGVHSSGTNIYRIDFTAYDPDQKSEATPSEVDDSLTQGQVGGDTGSGGGVTSNANTPDTMSPKPSYKPSYEPSFNLSASDDAAPHFVITHYRSPSDIPVTYQEAIGPEPAPVDENECSEPEQPQRNHDPIFDAIKAGWGVDKGSLVGRIKKLLTGNYVPTGVKAQDNRNRPWLEANVEPGMDADEVQGFVKWYRAHNESASFPLSPEKIQLHVYKFRADPSLPEDDEPTPPSHVYFTADQAQEPGPYKAEVDKMTDLLLSLVDAPFATGLADTWRDE